MKYLLDTNICSYIIKHRPLEVLAKFKTLQMEDCGMSAITYAELKYWVARHKRLHIKSKNQGQPKINEVIIEQFAAHLNIVEFGSTAAVVYADIRDVLEAKGISVGAADLMIGAHAISLDAILVTNNIKDFIHFPQIQLENWVST